MPKPEQLLSTATLTAAETAWQRAQKELNHTTLSLGTTSLLGVLNANVQKARESGSTGFDGL